MEILGLLDKLESNVTTSGRIPATRKVLLDMDKVLDMIDQIRIAVPKDVQEAEEILMKRESVVNQALMESRRIKSDAENESRHRLEQSELVKEAHRMAEETLSDAKRRADLLLQDAQRKAHQTTQDAQGFAEGRIQESSHYAQDVLLRLEQQLSSLLNSVRRGLDTLDVVQKGETKATQTAGEHREKREKVEA
ncbi:MAG: hypothetical protein HYY31_05545 [Chloroflexi bacterium]|nr:hypothetical protein [Chloroflexota bacterium]